MTNFKFNNNGFGLTQVAQGYVVDSNANKKYSRVFLTTNNFKTVVVRIYGITQFGLTWDSPQRYGFLGMEEIKSEDKGTERVSTIDFKFNISQLLSLGWGNLGLGINNAMSDILNIHFYIK